MDVPATEAPENTSGLRSVLSLAPAYRLAQRMFGADHFRRVLVDDILEVTADDRILDYGCGTADIVDHLPDVDYVGFDPSQRYVDDATARFGRRGTFVTDLADLPGGTVADRTLVMAIGVFHHLDDDTVRDALTTARAAVGAHGRFVSIDPTFTDDQHRVATWLIERDRGRHVRRPERVAALVGEQFPTTTVEVRHDLLRMPYTHAIVRATVGDAGRLVSDGSVTPPARP